MIGGEYDVTARLLLSTDENALKQLNLNKANKNKPRLGVPTDAVNKRKTKLKIKESNKIRERAKCIGRVSNLGRRSGVYD